MLKHKINKQLNKQHTMPSKLDALQESDKRINTEKVTIPNKE